MHQFKRPKCIRNLTTDEELRKSPKSTRPWLSYNKQHILTIKHSFDIQLYEPANDWLIYKANEANHKYRANEQTSTQTTCTHPNITRHTPRPPTHSRGGGGGRDDVSSLTSHWLSNWSIQWKTWWTTHIINQNTREMKLK